MLTLDISKFPSTGKFDCVFGRDYTPEKIAEKAKNWTGDDTLFLELHGYSHLLKEVKNPAPKAEPPKVEKPTEETKDEETPKS